jgi:hypothetical protein
VRRDREIEVRRESGILSGAKNDEPRSLGAVLFVLGRLVVYDVSQFGKGVPLVEPAAEIDQPATVAAERQRRRFGGLKITFAGRATHGNDDVSRGSTTRRSSFLVDDAAQSFFGFFGFDFDSLVPESLFFDSPPDEDLSDDFSADFSLLPESLDPSDDFLSFSAAFLYDSLR